MKLLLLLFSALLLFNENNGFISNQKRMVLSTDENFISFFPLTSPVILFTVNTTKQFDVYFTTLPSLTDYYYKVSFGANGVNTTEVSKPGTTIKFSLANIVTPNKFKQYKFILNHRDGEFKVEMGANRRIFDYKDTNYITPQYFGIGNPNGSTSVWNFDFEKSLSCHCSPF